MDVLRGFALFGVLVANLVWYEYVGRMALTNYLTHSFVFLFVLTGVGLGAAGRFGASMCVAISVVVFAIQIVISAWWLRRYRFGPVEWLWRSLTYGSAQPMRIARRLHGARF